MNRILQEFRILLTSRDKWHLVLLVVMMLIAALMELAGFGVLLPVAAVFLKPEWMEHPVSKLDIEAGKLVFLKPEWMEHPVLQEILHFCGIRDSGTFVLAGTAVLAGVFTVKALFSLWVVREQAKFICGKEKDLSIRLYRNYLSAPFEYSSTHAVSEWSAMLNMVDQLCNCVLLPVMTMMTDILLVLVLVSVLLYVIPYVTICGGAFMLAAGVFISVVMKRRIRQWGGKMTEVTVKLSRSRFDGLANGTYLKLSGGAETAVQEYGKWYRDRMEAGWKLYFFGQIPRLFLEWSAILAALAIFCGMVWKGCSPADILFQFSLLVAAMARMLPGLSRIHYALVQIRQYGYMFDLLFQDLANCPAEELPDGDGCPATLKDALEFRHVSFGYAGEKTVIRDYSLKIRARESVAVVGKTGCGKSTLAGLAMGLLKPDSGEILADGRPLGGHLKSWRKLVGYVPQAIYLMDDTVRNNVALGVPAEEIDDARVRDALEMAQLLADVEKMPGYLDAPVGENGMHLSGGQRQRLAIARALYRNPELLVLDEATSALDHATEEALVQSLESLKGHLTMLVIAHRLSTVKNCDRVISLDEQAK